MVQERLEKIMRMIHTSGMVNAAELAHCFGVSLETIRRDLEYLENKEMLKRVYGGAIANSSHGLERDYTSRETLNLEQKRAIAKCTAEIVKDGDTVALDLGTTVLQVAKQLSTKQKVTYVTNSLPVGVQLAGNPTCRLYILGGELRSGDFSTSGFMSEWGVMNFRVDKAIVSASGITLKSGITDYDVAEAEVRRKMIEIANQTILVADSSKFTDDAFVKVCDLDKIDILITDWMIPDKVVEIFRSLRTKLIVAQQDTEASDLTENPHDELDMPI